MNYDLDHIEVRSAVKKLCEEFSSKYWQKCDREKSYPTEFVSKLTEKGYLSVLIPEKFGGLGQPISVGAAILEEIHRSGGNAGACHAQMYTMGTLLRYGSEFQKKKYLPQLASGKLRLQAFGVTEPNSGTDTLSLTTSAVLSGDHYKINGQKLWTSRAEHSDLLLLLARTTVKDKVKNKKDGLSVFLVDMRTVINKSLVIKKVSTMMNHSSTELFFDNMIVPKENLIGEEGRGFDYILSGMNAERILIAAECIGDAKWFIEKSSQYATDRKVFGRPIGMNQGIQFPIARAYSQMRGAELMLKTAMNQFETGNNAGEEANLAKLLSADASWTAAEACLQTFGGFGFAEEYDVERKYREARLYQVAPISTNLILSYLAEHILKMPRSY